jgi:hypothetical protein
VLVAAALQSTSPNGTVRRSTIGARILREGNDLARLRNGVVFVDNGTDVQSATPAEIPLPAPLDPQRPLSGPTVESAPSMRPARSYTGDRP